MRVSIQQLAGVLALCMVLAGCGGDDKDGGDADMLMDGVDTVTMDVVSDAMPDVPADAPFACGTEGCADDALCCDYMCVDPTTDPANCGACGSGCAEGQTCAAGLCSCGDLVCGADQECCLEPVAACLNLDVDQDNCGACGNVCADGERCLQGTCSCQNSDGSYEACAADETCCAGTGCQPLDVDPQNCGACGLSCGSGELCVGGDCACGSITGSAGPACADTEACCGSPATCRPMDDAECQCGTVLCGSGQSCCDIDSIATCVSTWREPQHCGGCGLLCGAAQSCLGGQCRCQGGVADCNMDDADGCESRLDRDPMHCGSCGLACAAGEVCDGQGNCALECQTGLADCDGLCVDLNWDREHCGACNNACLPGQVANGAGQCALTCLAGLTDCNGECVQIMSNRSHCGTCGTVCAPGEVCDGAGRCALTCVTGLTDCAGNCVELATDRAHCGACGNACGSGEVCDAGVCSTTCQAGATECAGACVNVLSNQFHCGTCGTACGPGERCLDGSCTVDCGADPNVVSCDGQCVDLRTSRQHCGACPNACASSERCESGMCVDNCLDGFTACGGVCVDTATSDTHCGQCGQACGGTESCVDGACCDAILGCPQPRGLAVSNTFACAINEVGGVFCWGDNTYGQLGSETLARSASPVASLYVDGTTESALDIATGQNHTCVVSDNTMTKRVLCWGRNNVGQLGSGDRIDSTLPMEVQYDWTNNPASAVTTGDEHTCALLESGNVICWGANTNGQLGEGQLNTFRTLPVQVQGLAANSVLEIAAVDQTTCALAQDPMTTHVYCWGQYHLGGCMGCTQSNPESMPDSTRAVRSMGADLTDVVSLRAGANFDDGMQSTSASAAGFCASTATGASYCWHGGMEAVVLPANYASVYPRAGLDAKCAISLAGVATCWGTNEVGLGVIHGQLGHSCTKAFNDCTPNETTPMPVVDDMGVPLDAVKMAVADHYGCVIRVSGQIACWGQNSSGQLADGASHFRLPGPTLPLPSAPSSISGSQESSCVTTASDGLWCWGRFVNNGQSWQGGIVPAQIPNSTGAIDSATTWQTACFVDSMGGVWCAGGASDGQLGDGCSSGCADTTSPTAVVGIDGVAASATAVVGGKSHFCALLTGGAVRCWGDNYLGKLGSSGPTTSSTPLDVAGLATIDQVVLGNDHTCARTSTGAVHCWGENNYGQLGDNLVTQFFSDTPVAVVGFDGSGGASSATLLAAGARHTIAVAADGSVWGWGHNTTSQLGPVLAGNTVDGAPRPITGFPTGSVVDLGLGLSFSCFLMSTGDIYCMGANATNNELYPILPLGTDALTETDQPRLVSITDAQGMPLSVNFVSLDAGLYHVCAVSDQNEVWCWGDNTWGQQGDGAAFSPWAVSTRL